MLLRLAIGTLLLLLPGVAPAALFDEATVLEVTLTGPLARLARDKTSREEHPFTLSVGDHHHTLAVRARGNSRRKACDLPPLRLDFPADGPTGSPFSGQDKLKLVRPCTRGDAADADVLEEYAAYRLLNQLTPVSLRVRLLRVTFVDTTNNRDRSSTRWAFVIEPPAALADRAGGVALRTPGISLDRLDAGQAATVFAFQYLIGNADWSLAKPRGKARCCHNVELLYIDQAVYPVPYDFDLTGLVNPRYAKTQPQFRHRRVERRRWRGYCIDEAAVHKAIADSHAQADALRGVLTDLPGLEPRARERALRYVADYLDRATDPDALLRTVRGQCLGP